MYGMICEIMTNREAVVVLILEMYEERKGEIVTTYQGF
jgi:hypothetical protein